MRSMDWTHLVGAGMLALAMTGPGCGGDKDGDSGGET